MTEERLRDLLKPYVHPEGVPALAEVPGLYSRLSTYLELLLRWNGRTNLTAIREPEGIVKRHFGESLFAAAHLAPHIHAETTLLDFGSGAGFPGLPIQIASPGLCVTLAESQGKKAAFLREVVRTLGLNTEVWAARAEAMASTRRFDIVTLRAVDRMDAAREAAGVRLAPAGLIAELTVASERGTHLWSDQVFSVPGSDSRVLRLWSKAY